jgi:hypothetical protein
MTGSTTQTCRKGKKSWTDSRIIWHVNMVANLHKIFRKKILQRSC